MLPKFNNEVLSKGSDAVLPQNLSRDWLYTLQNIAEEFLENNFSLDECRESQDVADPILSTCVYEILTHQHGDIVDVSIQEMVEMIAIYAISIIMEAVDRESDIRLDPPDLDNILSIDRIITYKTINPKFITLLEQACIIRNADKKWFQNIKEKIL